MGYVLGSSNSIFNFHCLGIGRLKHFSSMCESLCCNVNCVVGSTWSIWIQDETTSLYGVCMYSNVIHCVQNYKLSVSTDRGMVAFCLFDLL